jgi:hypothetical protein
MTTFFDRMPRGECPACGKFVIVRVTPDGDQLIWEHTRNGTDGRDWARDYCREGSWQPPKEVSDDGPAGEASS